LEKDSGNCGRRLESWKMICYRCNIASNRVTLKICSKSSFWSHQVHLQKYKSQLQKRRQQIHKSCCFVFIHLVYTNLFAVSVYLQLISDNLFWLLSIPPKTSASIVGHVGTLEWWSQDLCTIFTVHLVITSSHKVHQLIRKDDVCQKTLICWYYDVI